MKNSFDDGQKEIEDGETHDYKCGGDFGSGKYGKESEHKTQKCRPGVADKKFWRREFKSPNYSDTYRKSANQKSKRFLINNVKIGADGQEKEDNSGDDSYSTG